MNCFSLYSLEFLVRGSYFFRSTLFTFAHKITVLRLLLNFVTEDYKTFTYSLCDGTELVVLQGQIFCCLVVVLHYVYKIFPRGFFFLFIRYDSTLNIKHFLRREYIYEFCNHVFLYPFCSYIIIVIHI